MDYALIGKIEKSKLYASEPERFEFQSFQATLNGDNGETHLVSLNDARWSCSCEFFQKREVCSHTMAMERMLNKMLPKGPSV